MDPEIKVTSAGEAPEFKVTSATAGPEVGGTSAAEAPEIEVTSAAEGPEVGGSSAALAPGGLEVRKYWMHDSNSSSDSIFRAPEHMRYSRESDFEPKLVSIGPYHRGRPNLQKMEAKKDWCMSNLLMMRVGDESKGENKFMLYNRGESIMDRVPVEPFMKFESRARSYYKEKFDQISDVEFVQMLLLDSCFVIRILLSLSGMITESMGSLEVNIKGVRSDLLLLENQIPLFFLNVLYYWIFPNAHKYMEIRVLLLWFIQRDLPWEYSYNCMLCESDHLLDFYWKSSVPMTGHFTAGLFVIMGKDTLRQTTSWASNLESSLPKMIVNATELYDTAGIKFQRDLSEHSPPDEHPRGVQVQFSKGIIRMRCLKIDSTVVTLLVNLIAFENSLLPQIRIISTYIKLLDDLIDSEKDVELIQKSGAIFNTLSTHTKAATFFNDIGNLCLIKNDPEDKKSNPFFDLFENVDKYYNSSWNRNWANLQQNYFNSPWAGISAFAGVILLILTVLATFYTIYAYYNPRN